MKLIPKNYGSLSCIKYSNVSENIMILDLFIFIFFKLKKECRWIRFLIFTFLCIFFTSMIMVFSIFRHISIQWTLITIIGSNILIFLCVSLYMVYRGYDYFKYFNYKSSFSIHRLIEYDIRFFLEPLLCKKKKIDFTH